MRNLPVKAIHMIARRPKSWRSWCWAGGITFVGVIFFSSLSAFNRAEAVSAKQEKLAADLDLLKRILSNLVPTVKGMEAGGSPSKDEPLRAARTIQVKVPRANLRSAPSVEGELLISISEGAVLVEHERVGQWIRTTAPTGQDAWISAELVESIASLG